MNAQFLIPLVATVAALHLPAAADDYTLHEWGTFTTVVGSDGTHLDGVEKEEAPLPAFVHQLDGLRAVDSPNSTIKGIDYRRPLAGVNVRMETPVVYFYTDRAFDAQVDVCFHGGTISEWFPDRSAGETLPPLLRNHDMAILGRENLIDFGQAPREGSICWNVRVEPAGEDQAGRVFHGDEIPYWLHPRQTDSALVTTAQGETEKYLFYRGLGHLNLPVIFSATDQELTAENRGAETVGRWLVFDLNAQHQARWSLPAPITPAAQTPNHPAPAVMVPLQAQPYQADWKKPLYAEAVKMLTSAGLYRKEADAMLQTWWQSYFERPGIRVFWIVPRSYVDQTLPLAVAPAPRHTERVIVGRTEILTPAFEQTLLAGFAAVTTGQTNPWTYDRFLPAYTARVAQLEKKKLAATARQIR